MLVFREAILVFAKVNPHLRHGSKTGLSEEGVPYNRRLYVALHALFVSHVSAPLHKSGTRTLALLRRMGMEDIKHA